MEESRFRDLIDKTKKGLAYHFVDTTSLIVSTFPPFAAMEVGLMGMSDKVSIDSRLAVVGVSYLGLSSAYSRGRDVSRKFFKINKETKEKIQSLHDVAYTFAFNFSVMPIFYSFGGADLKQAIMGGFSAATLGAILGPLMGYSVDVGRDLSGLENSDRSSYPEIIKKQRPSIKKGLAGLLVAGSFAAMAGIYGLTNDDPKTEVKNKQSIEQTVFK